MSGPDYLYTPLFCEENIWQLAKRLVAEGIDPQALEVLFISNAEKEVVLFNQRLSDQRGYVVWDYHVILRSRQGADDRVYDYDSRLAFPVATADYFAATFPLQRLLVGAPPIILRVIPALSHLRDFYSDRSHMSQVIAAGEFPPWPAITPNQAQVVRLDSYWDMEGSPGDGSRVISVDAYMAAEL